MLRTLPTAEPPAPLPWPAAAALQADLRLAGDDLDRLQRLLAEAGEALSGHFQAAADGLLAAAAEPARADAALQRSIAHVSGAITAMQFQDLAAQLIDHTSRRLRDCAERLAPLPEGAGAVPAPRTNPVTQDAMDSGSVELF